MFHKGLALVDWLYGFTGLFIALMPDAVDLIGPVGLHPGQDVVNLPAVQFFAESGHSAAQWHTTTLIVRRRMDKGWCHACAVPLSGGGGYFPSAFVSRQFGVPEASGL